MRNPPVSRRTLLQGIGSIGIGLPLLEEMHAASSAAVPVRALNVFFGLGIPSPLQVEGYEGVLEPLKPLRDKLLVLRNVDQVRCDQKGINAHFDGASGAFTAEPPDGEAKSGGPSIDQVVREAAYPDGLPPGMVPTLIAGTFFRRSRVSRYVHSYKADGTVAGVIQEKPRDLFDRVFGTVSMPKDTNLRKERLKRSVLDSVVDQYKFYTGANSPLGNASKGRISDHLEKIREYEQRAYEMRERDPNAPDIPPRSQLKHGGQADPGGEGIDITLEELSTEWRLMAELYALALQMDRARFGAITFLAAGERIRLTGDYVYNGEKRFEFNDRDHLNATGSKGCSHEYWHKFNEKKENKEMRAHIHMKMREVAYFLSLLDGKEAQEANGRSILENSLLTISTESGDGRHSDTKRELSGIFHAVSSANGRFKTGEVLDVGAEGLDVYNTMLTAMKAPRKLGPSDRKARSVDKIRA